MTALVDSGILYAYLSRRDSHHEWAVACFQRFHAPALTCEAVLSEVMYLLRREGGDPAKVLEMVSTGALAVGLSVEGEAEALMRLSVKYRERASLADVCLVRMSEMYPSATVATTDEEDFLVYRRNGRGHIPLLIPPKKQR